ncbi:hypothetical protein BJ944DRAFT_260724 [Cunninghamella echinulata]|nr:hypothetical protein BJ944DRAFT_260724 [Cunninghamella echinulata]
MNENHKPLSDTEILVLDYIFVFGKEQEKISVTCFSLENYRQVVNDILYLKIENIIPKSSLVNKWCNQLSNGNVFSWRDVKLKTIPMLYEAIQSTNEDDLLAADIIHNLAGRILDNPDRKNMLEDSFAHKYLDVILETIFGSERRFKQDWANGSLLGNKRKLECLDSSNDEENDNDNENQNILYKPDWLVYTKSWRTKAVLGVMELKVAYKRNPSLISDFVKLGREMKLTLNELIYRGIKNPMVCGILIEGFECQTFVMDLNYDGIYRLSAISKFKLCCNIQEFVLFPTLFNNILYLKKLIMEVALQVEKCDLDRQLGKEIEGSIPLNWIRPMVGSIKRL